MLKKEIAHLRDLMQNAEAVPITLPADVEQEIESEREQETFRHNQVMAQLEARALQLDIQEQVADLVLSCKRG